MIEVYFREKNGNDFRLIKEMPEFKSSCAAGFVFFLGEKMLGELDEMKTFKTLMAKVGAIPQIGDKGQLFVQGPLGFYKFVTKKRDE